MTSSYRWRDVMEEVTGRHAERCSSPWDVLSMITGPTASGAVRVAPGDVDLSTRLGQGERAPRLGMPLVLTDNSRGQLSPHARLAMLRSASSKGCALRLGDPPSDYMELATGLRVPVWVVLGPRRGLDAVRAISHASVVEVQLTDVDEDGGVSYSVDAISGDGSMETVVTVLRELSPGAAVVVNLGPMAEPGILRTAMGSGADAVMVQALSRESVLHPRMAGPDPLAAVASMRRARLRATRPEGASEPRIVVSGGFKDGVEVAKALALGADLVTMGTSVRMALGCTLCGDCGPGECPKMVLGREPGGSRASPEWKREAEGLTGFLERVASQLRTSLAQMGCATAGEAVTARLQALTYDAAAVTGVPLAGYGEVLPMWLH